MTVAGTNGTAASGVQSGGVIAGSSAVDLATSLTATVPPPPGRVRERQHEHARRHLGGHLKGKHQAAQTPGLRCVKVMPGTASVPGRSRGPTPAVGAETKRNRITKSIAPSPALRDRSTSSSRALVGRVRRIDTMQGPLASSVVWSWDAEQCTEKRQTSSGHADPHVFERSSFKNSLTSTSERLVLARACRRRGSRTAAPTKGGDNGGDRGPPGQPQSSHAWDSAMRNLMKWRCRRRGPPAPWSPRRSISRSCRPFECGSPDTALECQPHARLGKGRRNAVGNSPARHRPRT